MSAQVVGWLAHWRQMMMQKGGVKILRPRQLYVGEGKRDYVEIDARDAASTSAGSEPTEVRCEGNRRGIMADVPSAGPAYLQQTGLPCRLQGQEPSAKQAVIHVLLLKNRFVCASVQQLYSCVHQYTID